MSLIARGQDWVARHLGLEPPMRSKVLAEMLQARAGEGVGYWLQLMMAAALATLGLALDSTAVVIGAMLIAPLMKPIVALAMGLATGSAVLALRAGGRCVASLVAVVVASTAIAWLLPFHELTSELAARTAPSLIDLFVAGACALVGAYSTMFSSSDMASTAAGTSIGISLVPPLCTLGYTLSIADWPRAGGAALLFTANVTGIITVAGIVFVIVGFGRVDASPAAEVQTAAGRFTDRIGRNVSRATRRLGAFSRLVLPLLLLAAIYIPLRRAVREMTRRVELRQGLEKVLNARDTGVAHSSVELGIHGVSIRAVVIGDGAASRQVEKRLRDTLVRFGEASATVLVWAVPDARSLGELAIKIEEQRLPMLTGPLRDLAHHTPDELLDQVARVWPSNGTGALVSAWMEPGLPPRIHVLHLGAPLGVAGSELLQHALSVDEPVLIVDVALESVEAAASDGIGWVGRALAIAERARMVPGLSLCLVVPAPPVPAPVPGKRARPRKAVSEDPTVEAVRAVIERTFEAVPAATIIHGDRWSLVPMRGSCPPPSP